MNEEEHELIEEFQNTKLDLIAKLKQRRKANIEK